MSGPVFIDLTEDEVAGAHAVALQRQLRQSRERRHRGQGQTAGEAADDMVIGVMGEWAVAKWLDRYPAMQARDSAQGDVGRLQVRTSARHDRLVLYPYDKPGAYLFVLGHHAPRFELCGWLDLDEGRAMTRYLHGADRHADDRTWRVHRRELHDLDTLPGLVAA